MKKNSIENENHYNSISDAFNSAGLYFNWELEDMLSEANEHQGGRRGSGFTQATRVLADIINLPDNKFRISKLFNLDKIKDGYDLINDTEKLYVFINEHLNKVLSSLNFESPKKFVLLIMDLFNLRELNNELPIFNTTKKELPRIGTCTTAEIYFYDYLSNNPNWCRFLDLKNSSINIIVKENSEPIFLEKKGIGEQTAIVLSSFILNGCEIPEGSLVQLDYDNSLNYKTTMDNTGFIIPIHKINNVRFLRFTPLISSPDERSEVFNSHLKHQIENEMFNAENITIQDFKDKIQYTLQQ